MKEVGRRLIFEFMVKNKKRTAFIVVYEDD